MYTCGGLPFLLITRGISGYAHQSLLLYVLRPYVMSPI